MLSREIIDVPGDKLIKKRSGWTIVHMFTESNIKESWLRSINKTMYILFIDVLILIIDRRVIYGFIN